MKVFFPKRIDDSFCPCPFIGFRANSPKEFKEIIKQFYNEETGYPGLYFSTSDDNILMIFAGHQYIHPDGKPWRFFNRETDTHVDLNGSDGWFSMKEWDGWFDLLKDADEIDFQLNALQKIVETQGGLTIEIK